MSYVHSTLLDKSSLTSADEETVSSWRLDGPLEVSPTTTLTDTGRTRLVGARVVRGPQRCANIAATPKWPGRKYMHGMSKSEASYFEVFDTKWIYSAFRSPPDNDT